MTTEYSPEALGDLAAIWAYFAAGRSEIVATRILRDVQAKIAKLEKHPTLGIERPEIGKSVRSLSLVGHDYVTYYLISGRSKRVQIVRILHGRRDVRVLLGRIGSPLSAGKRAVA